LSGFVRTFALRIILRSARPVRKGDIIPVYILDDHNSGEWAMGGASRWWLHHALESLNESLQGKLNIFSGDPLSYSQQLVKQILS